MTKQDYQNMRLYIEGKLNKDEKEKIEKLFQDSQESFFS